MDLQQHLSPLVLVIEPGKLHSVALINLRQVYHYSELKK